MLLSLCGEDEWSFVPRRIHFTNLGLTQESCTTELYSYCRKSHSARRTKLLTGVFTMGISYGKNQDRKESNTEIWELVKIKGCVPQAFVPQAYQGQFRGLWHIRKGHCAICRIATLCRKIIQHWKLPFYLYYEKNRFYTKNQDNSWFVVQHNMHMFYLFPMNMHKGFPIQAAGKFVYSTPCLGFSPLSIQLSV